MSLKRPVETLVLRGSHKVVGDLFSGAVQANHSILFDGRKLFFEMTILFILFLNIPICHSCFQTLDSTA